MGANLELKQLENETIELTDMDFGVEDDTPSTEAVPTQKRTRRLGVSRPEVEVVELPQPEEVFNSPRIGLEELILSILGPSIIALGASLGNVEWLTAPLLFAAKGIKGLGFLVLVATILQVFYNVELARFTLATGESPILGFGRVPPGYWFWIPLSLLILGLAFIMGRWTLDTGASLYALLTGGSMLTDNPQAGTLLGIASLFGSAVILTFGRRLVRSLEVIQGAFIPYVIFGLIIITLLVVPGSYLRQSGVEFLTPAMFPEKIPAADIGTLVGFIALAAGLNFMFTGYYRDKGYGMGAGQGAFSGIFSGRASSLRVVGKTFEENEHNAQTWKRWFRYVLVDQWALYFPLMLAGIALPIILVTYTSKMMGPTAPLSSKNILTYLTAQLGSRYGSLVEGWTLVTGFVILFSAQLAILDMLARNFTEGFLGISSRIKRWAEKDVRRLYYPVLFSLFLLIGISSTIEFPSNWVDFMLNLPNLAGMVFPLILIYLNGKLPRPAKIRWWSYIVLLLTSVFFGYFWVRFLLSVI